MTPENPGGADVLVVGEALMDIVHRSGGATDETPGGSPANVALTLGRLGRHPRLLTSIGEDARGRAVERWLGASGVRVVGTRAARTSIAEARLDADGAATYDFEIDWDIDIDDHDASGADVLHIGSIGAVREPGAASVSSLVDRLRTRALITYDPNIRPGLLDDDESARHRIMAHVARAHVVKASDEDLAWLLPGVSPADIARSWVRSGPALVVVTCGAAGAIAVTPAQTVEIDAEPVRVIDTVGAGDTFMGTLIDGLISEGARGPDARRVLEALGVEKLDLLLRRCARAAAITVSRPGADPPTREDLDDV